MINLHQAQSLPGKTLLGSAGETLGTIIAVFADSPEGNLTFAAVNTGAADTVIIFVPLADATWFGGDVTVPYSKDVVEAAPSIDADFELDPADEQRLYRHYGIPFPPAHEHTSGSVDGPQSEDRDPGNRSGDWSGARGWDDGEPV